VPAVVVPAIPTWGTHYVVQVVGVKWIIIAPGLCAALVEATHTARKGEVIFVIIRILITINRLAIGTGRSSILFGPLLLLTRLFYSHRISNISTRKVSIIVFNG
jgi:hypothetical protein